MKSAKRLKTRTLTDFAKRIRKHAGGQRSPLDDHSEAREDVIMFGKQKFAGETSASWNEFAAWLKATHGLVLRGNSLCQWCHNWRIQHG